MPPSGSFFRGISRGAVPELSPTLGHNRSDDSTCLFTALSPRLEGKLAEGGTFSCYFFFFFSPGLYVPQRLRVFTQSANLSVGERSSVGDTWETGAILVNVLCCDHFAFGKYKQTFTFGNTS